MKAQLFSEDGLRCINTAVSEPAPVAVKRSRESWQKSVFVADEDMRLFTNEDKVTHFLLDRVVTGKYKSDSLAIYREVAKNVADFARAQREAEIKAEVDAEFEGIQNTASIALQQKKEPDTFVTSATTIGQWPVFQPTSKPIPPPPPKVETPKLSPIPEPVVPKRRMMRK
jgi:hypothetical protein